MLLVDSRTGSADLADPLRDMGLDVETTALEFSDICFEGRGDDDNRVAIGIELKKLPDLVSSLRTGRLSGHQVPGLSGPDKIFDWAWVLIEGHYRPSETGLIEVPKPKRRFKQDEWGELPGKMTLAEMEKRVTTLELLCGLHVRYTSSRDNTLHFLANLYRWWTDRPMDQHTSHLTPHTAHGFLPLSDFRQTVMRFPNVGLRTSKAVEDYFMRPSGEASLQDAVNASAAEWAEILTVDKSGKPRRLGAKAAQNIINFVKGQRP